MTCPTSRTVLHNAETSMDRLHARVLAQAAALITSPQDETDKAIADLLAFGSAAMLNGKHIPVADIADAARLTARYCDHCGAPTTVATRRCSAPFERQPHQWTGRHPADQRERAEAIATALMGDAATDAG